MLWLIAIHIIFIHLNARKNYQLYRSWMKLTFEKRIDSEHGWRVAGLSRTENRKFWLTENRFNFYFYWVLYISLFIFSFFFNAMFFVIRFKIDLCTYILLQAINIAQFTFLVFTFLPQIYVVSLLILNLLRFFSKRFLYMKKKVERLTVTKRVNNRKLARLIREHNCVHFDLIEMNLFFRPYLGVNFVCFCAMGVLSAFNLIHESIDWKIKVYLYAVTLGMYSTIIAIPFKFANSLTTAVNILLVFFD